MEIAYKIPGYLGGSLKRSVGMARLRGYALVVKRCPAGSAIPKSCGLEAATRTYARAESLGPKTSADVDDHGLAFLLDNPRRGPV